MRAWFDQRFVKLDDFGELSGEFRFTGVHVHYFQIKRNGFDVQLPKLDTIETDETLDYAYQQEVEIAHNEPTQNEPGRLLQVETAPSHILTYQHVPANVYEALTVLIESEGGLPESIKRAAAKVTNRSAAAWIKKNNLDYGMGFYNGFTDGENTIPPQV